MKYYRISIDGIDKTGKDTIVSYIDFLSNRKYSIKSRGVMSLIAYSNLYNRKYEYDLTNEQNVVNILLVVDYEDWKIRCKLTNEKDVINEDYTEHNMAFFDAKNELLNAGYNVPCYNTSKYTPYQIAKDIIENLERLERGELWINELSQK